MYCPSTNAHSHTHTYTYSCSHVLSWHKAFKTITCSSYVEQITWLYCILIHAHFVSFFIPLKSLESTFTTFISPSLKTCLQAFAIVQITSYSDNYYILCAFLRVIHESANSWFAVFQVSPLTSWILNSSTVSTHIKLLELCTWEVDRHSAVIDNWQ